MTSEDVTLLLPRGGRGPGSREAGCRGKYHECPSCGHASTVPSDLNGCFDREKLGDDPPSSDRLNQSIISEEEGEGITQATFWKSPREGHPSF